LRGTRFNEAHRLLDLGVDIQGLYGGDAYFGIARDSTALHVAAWRARHQTVKLLLTRGASIDALDGEGCIALQLAVRACVDSYWVERRSSESVRALLGAGASIKGVNIRPVTRKRTNCSNRRELEAESCVLECRPS
jgi:hypothetical protein